MHDTIQDGILGSKLPAPRDMGYETGFGGPPTYYVTWYNYVNDDSSEGLSLYPYGAIDQYSGVNNVGSYLLYLVEPTVFQNPATTVSSNVIKLISLRIRAQQKKLYAALGLPSIVALINLINSQLGQTSQLGTPFMEWTVDEAFSILCLPVSGADETNQEKLAAFLLQTPEFRSYEVAPNRNMGQAATKQARPIPYGTTLKIIQEIIEPADGNTISDQDNGEVYRIAGGAPIYITTPALVGSGPVVVTTDMAFQSLNQIPADGTYIAGQPQGYVFCVAGGAPVYISDWNNIGGQRPFTDVDEVAIDRAGQATPFNHLNAVPADGTYLQGYQSGKTYRISAGAPQLEPVPPGVVPVIVDQVAIDNAGQSGVWSHLK